MVYAFTTWTDPYLRGSVDLVVKSQHRAAQLLAALLKLLTLELKLLERLGLLSCMFEQEKYVRSGMQPVYVATPLYPLSGDSPIAASWVVFFSSTARCRSSFLALSSVTRVFWTATSRSTLLSCGRQPSVSVLQTDLDLRSSGQVLTSCLSFVRDSVRSVSVRDSS